MSFFCLKFLFPPSHAFHTTVPKSIPGGKVPELSDDILKEHPYLKTFDTLSRNWSFISTSLTAALKQAGIAMFHPPSAHTPGPRPMAPLPPAFPSSLPNPFAIGSARGGEGAAGSGGEVPKGEGGEKQVWGARQSSQNLGRNPRVPARKGPAS
jgi:hypothetical protein